MSTYRRTGGTKNAPIDLLYCTCLIDTKILENYVSSKCKENPKCVDHRSFFKVLQMRKKSKL